MQQLYLLFKAEVLGQDARRHTGSNDEKRQRIDEILQPYMLDNATYEKIVEVLDVAMTKGMIPDQKDQSSLKMIPTYVRALPNGSEKGDFLALDLGGTNFRVLLVRLKGQEAIMKNKIFPISQKLMEGPGTDLFDHIVDCIAQFLKEHDIDGHTKLPLGFTFSFPVSQESLAVGKLISWTKGFNCSGVVGQDVVALLHQAIDRREDIDVECVAILNDTVGCLMSCAFTNHECEIGVILGTGTNACYMERLDRVKTWNGDDDPPQVVINTEWGAFGDNGEIDFVRTSADADIDRDSINPGKQLYEKMISGMYMGEIARHLLVQCANEGLILNGQVTEALGKQYGFFTKYLSEIEKDFESNSFENTRQIFQEVGYTDLSEDDMVHIRHICHVASERSAHLSAAGIATLLRRINKPNITVAMDGSLYRFHPLFHEYMIAKISELTPASNQFQLMLSEDGSGKGAALVAAVADRLKRK